MFNNILIKSFPIGERVFHVLCDIASTTDELEKLGLEIIKVANDIKSKAETERAPNEVKENEVKDV